MGITKTDTDIVWTKKLIMKKVLYVLHQKTSVAGDVGNKFKLISNEATSKAEFLFKDDYGVDFDVESSICRL